MSEPTSSSLAMGGLPPCTSSSTLSLLEPTACTEVAERSLMEMPVSWRPADQASTRDVHRPHQTPPLCTGAGKRACTKTYLKRPGVSTAHA